MKWWLLDVPSQIVASTLNPQLSRSRTASHTSGYKWSLRDSCMETGHKKGENSNHESGRWLASPLRAFSKFKRWSLMLPILMNPYSSVALSKTKSSFMCILSNINTTCFCHSSSSFILPSFISISSTSSENPIWLREYNLEVFLVMVILTSLIYSLLHMSMVIWVWWKDTTLSLVGAISFV